MSIAEKFEARGKAMGETEKTNTIAINMLKEGADLAFTAKVTGLTIEDIQQLQNSQKSS